MTANDEKNSKKTYRFALYGATGSGKTILLAALADHRPIFISNYSCNAVALGQEPSETKGKKFAHYQALKEGKKWLDHSRDALRSGNLPPPTETDHSDMLFEYKFGNGQRIYDIELTDYSGEWLASTLSSHERSIRLREQLKDKDALLVLAPAPPSNDGDCIFDVDAQRLSSLRESFSLLQSELDENALRMPVAMLVTKWDRFIALGDGNPEAAQNALNAFLERQPPPPHRGLFMALRGATIDPDHDFRAFPVSALGQCRDDGRPKRFSPLYSFGLEEPFFWAARRHDEIELAIYREKIAPYNFDKVYNQWIPWPFSLAFLSLSGHALIKRLPEADPLRTEFKQEHVTVNKALWKRITSFALAAIFTWFIGEFSWDEWRYQTVIHAIADPKADAQSVQQAENWLKSYTESVFPRHLAAKLFLLKTDQAETTLTRLRSGREEIYWIEVKNASINEKKQKAEDYLEAFPNGRHKAEAISLIAKIVDQLSWEEFLRYYNSNLQEGKTVEAISFLKGRSDDPRIKDLSNLFETKALDILEGKIMDALRIENIEEASNYYDQIHQWPISFRTTKGYEREKKLRHAIDVAKDRQLYDRARTYPSDETLNAYLTTAPIGSMRREVKANLDWRNAEKAPMKLTLDVASIKWDDDSGTNGGIQLTIYVDGNKAIQIPDLKSRSGKKDVLLSGYRPYEFFARLDEEINIRVEFEDTDRWFGSKDIGSGYKKSKVRNINGLDIFASSEKMSHYVTLKLSGIEQEPRLPLWRQE